MPWSGAGTYSLPPAYSPEVNGTTIDAVRYNGLTSDVASGITAALAKNGENVPTANLPMGSFKHTGAADGNAAGQYMTWGNATGKLGNLDITANTLPPNGFYLPSANTLGFSTNTTQRGTINSTGNWAINAPTSGEALTIASNTGSVALNVTNGNSTTGDVMQFNGVDRGWYLAQGGTHGGGAGGIAFYDGFRSAVPFTIGGSGNVTINAPGSGVHTINNLSGGSGLVIKGSDVAAQLYDSTNTAFGQLWRQSATFKIESLVATDNIALSTGGALRLLINDTGNVGVNAPSSGTSLAVGGIDGNSVVTWSDGTRTGGLQVASGLGVLVGATSNHELRLIANNTVYGVLTSDGRLYGTALHNNAGAVTGTTNQYIASGTYTPTLTNTTNVASSSFTNSPPAKWIRVGNVVQVSGHVTITPTAAAGTQTVLDLSLPIASNITHFEDCSGVASDGASGGGTANSSALIQGSVADNRAQIVYAANNTNSKIFGFNFSYTVL